MVALVDAARVIYERGWVTHPLRNDSNGLPKVPMTVGWQELPHDWNIIGKQEWSRAAGIGIVLGAQSGNLAVLDVDDEALFTAYVASNLCPNWPRLVRTARNRGHVYFTELDGSSGSSKAQVVYQGRTITIELKAQGTQVACPPSPGYTLLYQDPPQLIHSIQDGFEFFMDCLEDFIPGQVKLANPAKASGSGYQPRDPSWVVDELRGVPMERRNDTATRLVGYFHQKGLPQGVIESMMLEWAGKCSPPMDRQELLRTVSSVLRYPGGIPMERGTPWNGNEARLIP